MEKNKTPGKVPIVTYPIEVSSMKEEKYMRKTIKRIIRTVNALMNSNGGRLEMTYEQNLPKNYVRDIIRVIEQKLISFMGVRIMNSKVLIKFTEQEIILVVKPADSLSTPESYFLNDDGQVMRMDSDTWKKKFLANNSISNNLEQATERSEIRQLNAAVYQQLCSSLNMGIPSKDYLALAGTMGYSLASVKTFQLSSNPADALLSSWQKYSGNDVHRLVQHLTGIGREDLVELLDESTDKRDTLKRPLGMRADAYERLCEEINNGDFGRDWEALAKGLKCSSEDIQSFEFKSNPSDAVLRNWLARSGSSDELISILVNMGRKDLKELLDCTTEEEYLSAVEDIEYNHAYNQALLEGKTKDTRMQVMIIGHDRSGKTSLVKNLLGLEFNPNEPSTTGVETEVVEITERNSRDAWPKKEKRLLRTADELHDHVFDVITKGKEDHPDKDVERPELASFDNSTVTSREYEGSRKGEESKEEEGSEKSEEDKEEDIFFGKKGAANEFMIIDKLDRDRARAKRENSGEEKTIRVMLQDFAGQELFHESHCCFLKSNCPVVLAYDARCNLEDIAKCSFKYKDGTEKNFDNPHSLTNQYSVSRWFKMLDYLRESESDDDPKKKFCSFRDGTGKLHKFVPPPVLIALTHRDAEDVDEQQIEKIKKKIIDIGNDYKNVFPRFYAIDNSSADGDDVKDLREILCLLCKALLKERDPVPLLWLKLEEKLQPYVDNKAVPYKVVEDVAREVGIKDVKNAIKFLHSRGVILFYSEDLPVILNPPWVLDRFKEVITVPQVRECEDTAFRASLSRLKNEAILEGDYLNEVLGQEGEFLKTVMERFGLICPWPCSNSNDYLVPSLAPLLPKGNEIDRSSDPSCPVAPVFLRFVRTLPSQKTRGIHVPGVFGKLQTELIKKLFNDSSSCDDNLTLGEASTSRDDSTSNNLSLDPNGIKLRGNYTLVPVSHNGGEFEVFMTEIVENVKIAVFCSEVEEETQRNFLSYLQYALKYSLSRIKDNRIPLYRHLKYQLAFKCSHFNGPNKVCSEHRQQNCERDSCLNFIKLENLSESSKYVTCEKERHYGSPPPKNMKVWLGYRKVIPKKTPSTSTEGMDTDDNMTEDTTGQTSTENNTQPPEIQLMEMKDINPTKIKWSEATKDPTDVLLIAVNDIEFRAAYQILSEQKSADSNKDLGNVYFGRVKMNKVALLRSSMGIDGNTAMLTTCLQAIKELDPKTIINVGVCFGMNRSKQELGDVVVSTKLACYEPSRVNDDGSSEFRGTISECDARLTRLFRDGKAGWESPGQGEVKSAVHCDLMISGSKLVDCKDFKQNLQQQFPAATGGEMEGAGLRIICETYGRPWIVCKAICDWGDGTKNKEWQPFAALAAASFVKHVLTKNYVPGAERK